MNTFQAIDNFTEIDGFPPISLNEMDSVKLMNRIDRKYLTDRKTLHLLLSDAASRGYRIFEKDGVRLHSYDSIYFDTDDLRMFKEHRRGKSVREKVRTRIYRDSGQAFLEVKRKNNHGRTKKSRTEIRTEDFADFRQSNGDCLWLAGHSSYRAEQLSPSIETSFRRMTIVNGGLSERLTIDTDVRFHNFRNGFDKGLANIVIIELKQDGRVRSDMQDIFLNLRVKPIRVSKYCIGVVSTEPLIHPGRFKEKLRAIRKIEDSAQQ